MPYTHRDCEIGMVMVFDPIGAGEATEGLETYQVQEVSFGVAVSNLDAQAVFQLEGKIGGNWFLLPSTITTITPTSFPATDKATGVLTYSHCASIEGIRCRFVSASDGELVPTAEIMAMGVQIA